MNTLRIALALSLMTPWQALAQVQHQGRGGQDPRRGDRGGAPVRPPQGGDRGGRREAPRRETPRQQPPVQQPPRREPPRQQPPVQQPPRQQPPVQQPPRREPPRQQPPVQQPPRREPPRQQPPRREPPRQQPPVQQPPRREPPRQQPPRQQPPRREPPRQRPPVNRPPHRQPPVARPPVVRPDPGRGRRMPRPERPADVVRDGRTVTHPRHDGRGGQLGGRHLDRAPNVTVVNRTINNVTIINNINTRVNMGSRLRPGGYYWHYDNGMRWAHYYDHSHVHWFGFYLGDVYFWSRWHSGRLWWHDARWGRWVYYREGHWWYHDPVNVTVVYIYRDGDYYRYTPVRGGYEVRPAPPSTPSQPPAEAPKEETEFYSEDGTRLVKVMGEAKEAFLYDNTGEDPAFLAFLADRVEAVQFAGGTEDAPLQILLTVSDEQGGKAFKLFDGDGNLFGAPADSVDPESQLGESAAFQSLSSGAGEL